MTVAELHERVSPEEFEEWRAFDLLHPLGDVGLRRQMQHIAWMYANVHRGDRKPLDFDDFDLQRDPPPPMTRAQEEARFLAHLESQGLVIHKPA